MKTRLRLLTCAILCSAAFRPWDAAVAQDTLRITRQPRDQIRGIFDFVTFSVEVESSNPNLFFQWEQLLPTALDWMEIPGANSSNYTFMAMACGQSRTRFRCHVSTPEMEVISDEAELTVICDCDPPSIVGVSGSASLDSLLVTFSDLMIPDTVTDIFNYSIDGLEVVEARMVDPWKVALTTSPQAPGRTYTLYTTNLSDYSDPDCGANLVSPFIGIDFTTPAWMPGLLRREYYGNIAGYYLTNLTSHPRFPFLPDQVSHLSSLEAPRMIGNGYGTRLSGFILPPISGSYHFYLSSDGASELYLSADDLPANKRLISSIPFWSGPREWLDSSGPIPLEQDKKYYIEVLLKEDFGPDHVAVAWQLPDGPPPQNGKDVIPGTYLGTYWPPATALQIVQQPQPSHSSWDCKASFAVRAQVQPPGAPVSYQWQRAGVDIPGATRATYVTGYLSGTDNGVRFRCRVSAPGISILSDAAQVTIGGDVVLPRLEGAFALETNKVAVIFNHPIEPPDIYSFQFAPDLRVDSASQYSFDPAIIIVETATLHPGLRYQLTVRDIHDLSGNTLWPNPSQTTFHGLVSFTSLDVLRVFPAGSKLIVKWSDALAVLQSSDSPDGPWQDLADAISPVVLGPRPDYCDPQPYYSRHFFRLRTGP